MPLSYEDKLMTRWMKLLLAVSFLAPSAMLSGPARADGYAKIEATEYRDDLANWILGQRSRFLVDGVEAERVDYDARSLPSKVYAFGKLLEAHTYNVDGTLASTSDGKLNETNYSSWKRGVPQITGHADQTRITKIVDDFGSVTSVTDENGFVTSYKYSPVGLLTDVIYPANDSSAWNQTFQSFGPASASEFGLPAGHWRQTTRTGNAYSDVYFDAMWRPVLIWEYDAADVAGTSVFKSFSYDYAGRKTFESYPVRSIAAFNDQVTGIKTSYDALGRVESVIEDSELGELKTTTSYLPGGGTRVQDPRGALTTTTYQVFDEPTYDWPVTVDRANGDRTQIARDVYGKVTSISRLEPEG